MMRAVRLLLLLALWQLSLCCFAQPKLDVKAKFQVRWTHDRMTGSGCGMAMCGPSPCLGRASRQVPQLEPNM